MPPSQRSHKNAKNKESLEVRRARGEISCAECRRHKLKCNRAIPCNTCIRKGCPELCPNGTLTPGQNARQSPGNDDMSMEKLVRMSQRIQHLEDALQIAHTSISAAPHPLLSKELLRMKGIVERPFLLKKESDTSDEDTVVSHGTLAMFGRGVESYVGTDKFIIDDFGSWDAMRLKVNRAVPTSYPSETFPFTPLYLPAQEIQTQIEEKLPTIERASALIEAYLENICWIHRIIDREQIMEELIPQVYWRRRVSRSNNSNEATMTDPHMLSSLLAVFACGAVADLTRSPWNEEADLYHSLAWTAISLRPVFDGANLHTVQTLALLGTYDIFSCRTNSLEGTWKLIGFCMSLASSIGLHRDPAHFNLPAKLIQRRRQLFWELHASDVWRSVGSGHPMTFSSSVVDCELPEDKDATVSDDGRKVPSLWSFRYRYSKEVMADVAEKLGSARALKYSEILSLDQKIHDFDPGNSVALAINASAKDGGSFQSVLTKFLVVFLKDASLLLLHRNFFIRALVVNPMNPMRCQFAPSFLSTYRSATAILRALRELSGFCSQLLVRIWPIWAHALSASVMLGSVAACGAESALAPQAFVEFNQSIDMLAKIQMHPVVKDLMPMLLRLRDQAHAALSRHGNSVPLYRPSVINRPPAKEEEKEFNTISSMGRILQMGLNNQRQNSQGLISGLLDEAVSPRSITPASTATPSSGLPEDSYNKRTSFDQGFMTLEHGSLRTDQKSPFGDAFSHSMGLSPVTIGGTSELLHSSRQSIDVGHDMGDLQCESSDTNNRHLPPQLQDRPMSIAPSDRSPASKLQEINRQDLNALYGANNEQRRPSNDVGGFPTPANAVSKDNYASSETHNVRNVDMQTRIDDPQPLLNFDNFSEISPKTLFDTDFDVSFNMRACAGDENILPLISDDCPAWHTILRDSRFFGNGDTVSDISL